MLHNDPVNNNIEDIGDIEWEGMPASDVKFDHVVGCSGAIYAIQESVVIPMQYPVLFQRLNVKRSNSRTTHDARTCTLMPNKSVTLSVSACQVSLH